MWGGETIVFDSYRSTRRAVVAKNWRAQTSGKLCAKMQENGSMREYVWNSKICGENTDRTIPSLHNSTKKGETEMGWPPGVQCRPTQTPH